MGPPPNKPRSRAEDFGDPLLANPEIIPVGSDQRLLGFGRRVPLWAAMGLFPSYYSVASGALPLRTALLAVAATTAVVGLWAVVVAITAVRYGLGFVPLCRAAFGGRGAWLPLLVRWLVGVGWLAAGVLALSDWAVRLLWVAEVVPTELRTAWIERGAVGVVSALLLAGAWWASRRGMARLMWLVPAGMATLIVGGFGLVVWAGIASQGFGTWFGRPLVVAPRAELALAGTIFGTACLAILSGPDWERFRAPFIRAERRRALVAAILAPLAMVPVAVGFAFVGALLAAASATLRVRWDAHLVPDAAGFGGIVAGGTALLLGVVAWLLPAALLGFYSGSLALCGLPVPGLGYRRGLNLTWVIAVGLVVLSFVFEFTAAMHGVLLLLAALAGVLLVDAIAVRRTRVVLEDLYLFTPGYGPVAGVTLSAVAAMGAGLLFHPLVVAHWTAAAAPLLPVALQPWIASLELGLSAPAAAAVGAFVFLLGAPVERGVVGLLRRLPRAGSEPGRPKPVRLSDSSSTAGLTDPHYVAGSKGEAKAAGRAPVAQRAVPAAERDSFDEANGGRDAQENAISVDEEVSLPNPPELSGDAVFLQGGPGDSAVAHAPIGSTIDLDDSVFDIADGEAAEKTPGKSRPSS